MRTAILVAVFTIASMAGVGTAHAGEFSMNGTSCVPDSSAIQANAYFGTGGTVQHSPSSLTNLVFYCPIAFSGSLTSPTTLLITYRDSTSVGSNFVKAQLIKMNMTTGQLTTIVTVSSDQSTPGFCDNANNISRCANSFSEAIATITNYYYVRVDIVRSSTSNQEVLYGVRLF